MYKNELCIIKSALEKYNYEIQHRLGKSMTFVNDLKIFF